MLFVCFYLVLVIFYRYLQVLTENFLQAPDPTLIHVTETWLQESSISPTRVHVTHRG